MLSDARAPLLEKTGQNTTFSVFALIYRTPEPFPAHSRHRNIRENESKTLPASPIQISFLPLSPCTYPACNWSIIATENRLYKST
jgi:hypothetical protein